MKRAAAEPQATAIHEWRKHTKELWFGKRLRSHRSRAAA